MSIAICPYAQAANEAGHSDGEFDGMWLIDKLECQCDDCKQAYGEGFDQGVVDAIGDSEEGLGGETL